MIDSNSFNPQNGFLDRINKLVTIFKRCNGHLPNILLVGSKEKEEVDSLQYIGQNVSTENELKETFGLTVEVNDEYSLWVK